MKPEPPYTTQAFLVARLVAALRTIIKISDRKHDAWDAAKALLREIDEGPQVSPQPLSSFGKPEHDQTTHGGKLRAGT